MIKFFRRIRQNLLSEGKTGKYLKYAIGEIVLVVIGILIALQLNVWKTEEEEKAKVLKYMHGVYQELNQDYERMDSLYVFYSGVSRAIQVMLSTEEQKDPLTNNDLGLLFNSALEYKKFANKKSTYLSIINDGFINKVNNEELVNQIIRYYESPFLSWSTEIYGNLLGSVDYNQSEIYDSRDILATLHNNNSIPEWQLTEHDYKTNYIELIHTKWAINIFSTCLKQSDFIFKNLNSYRAMNVKLREEIETYINKSK